MSCDFNAELYLASNPDVLNAVGLNLEAAREHYEEHGIQEGREQNFDAEEYLAANPDLIAAFHSDTTQALHHYLEYGSAEGRPTSFNAAGYLEANDDLKAAFGDNHAAALQHYLEHGYGEGREVEVHTGEDKEDDSDGTVTSLTITMTTTTTDSQTMITGTDATDTYVATGSVRFEGRGGADQLKLSERGGPDKVVFSAAGDGAAAGSKYGYDQIKNFQSGADKVIISSSLLSLTDHNGDGALTATSRNKNSISGSDELVFFSTEIDDLSSDGMSRIARAFGSVTGAGDVLVAATHEGESALYLVHARGGALAGSDIRMLGLFKDTTLLSGSIVAG